MKYDSLSKIKTDHIKFLKEKGWDHQHTPSMVVISLVTELGELLEHLLWKKDSEIIEFAKEKENKNNISEELVDVLFNVIELAHRLGVDLPSEAEKKIKKNHNKYKDDKWYGKMASSHKSPFIK